MALALGIRGALGRGVALPMYLIALWTALASSACSALARPNPCQRNGVPRLSRLAPGCCWSSRRWRRFAMLWDNLTWAVFIPALVGMTAALATPGLRGVALTVALVATGMLLRQVRGRWQWSFVWYIAALLAALYQLLVLMVRAFINSSAPPDRAM